MANDDTAVRCPLEFLFQRAARAIDLQLGLAITRPNEENTLTVRPAMVQSLHCLPNVRHGIDASAGIHKSREPAHQWAGLTFMSAPVLDRCQRKFARWE